MTTVGVKGLRGSFAAEQVRKPKGAKEGREEMTGRLQEGLE